MFVRTMAALALVALPSRADTGTSRAPAQPDHIDIRSIAAGTPVTVALHFTRAPLSVGAWAPTGRVLVGPDSGTVTTPGFIELGPEPTRIELTVPTGTTPFAADMSSEHGRLHAIGRRMIVQRDSTGHLSVSADSTMRLDDR